MEHNVPPRKRILIVDDDERVRFVVVKALDRAEEDYQITTAQNGAEALQEIQAHTFDLLLSDLRLPHLDGVAVTEAFVKRFPDAAVLWMTAFGCHHVHQQAESLGVYYCLDKPVEVKVIRKTVTAALSSVTPVASPDIHRLEGDFHGNS